jgi:hypothetical protein
VPAEFSDRRSGFQIEDDKSLAQFQLFRVFEVMRNDDYSDVVLSAQPDSF